MLGALCLAGYASGLCVNDEGMFMKPLGRHVLRPVLPRLGFLTAALLIVVLTGVAGGGYRTPFGADAGYGDCSQPMRLAPGQRLSSEDGSVSIGAPAMLDAQVVVAFARQGGGCLDQFTISSSDTRADDALSPSHTPLDVSIPAGRHLYFWEAQTSTFRALRGSWLVYAGTYRVGSTPPVPPSFSVAKARLPLALGNLPDMVRGGQAIWLFAACKPYTLIALSVEGRSFRARTDAFGIARFRVVPARTAISHAVTYAMSGVFRGPAGRLVRVHASQRFTVIP